MNEDEFHKRLAKAVEERNQVMRDYLAACDQRDEARGEVQRLRAECDKASAMERHRIADWMMGQAAIEASDGGLHAAVAHSALVDLASAILSGAHDK